VNKKQVIKTSASRKAFVIINAAVLTVTMLICLLPFVNLLATSFSDKMPVIAREVTFYPIGFNTAAYEFILQSNAFVTALWVSVKRTFLGVLVNLVLIIFTAYPLSKTDGEFRARKYFSWFFVLTILFQAGMIPILAVYPFLQKYFTTGLVLGSVKG
jgi:putative aldouronate transport system permease protein